VRVVSFNLTAVGVVEKLGCFQKRVGLVQKLLSWLIGIKLLQIPSPREIQVYQISSQAL
jgi:hypothetical protein